MPGLVGVVFFNNHKDGIAVVELPFVVLFLWSECVKTSEVLQLVIKRGCLHPKGNLLLHDNARPYFATATAEAVGQLKSELLPHPHIVRSQLHLILTCLYH